MVSKHLEAEGFVIDYADNGLLGLKLGLSNEYDAIVLDLTLPGLDGIEVCERLRVENTIDTPILMLTARDTLEDKLQGFESGADDYLLKPFELEELSARLRALLRRNTGISSQSDLKVADLILCRQTEVVTRTLGAVYRFKVLTSRVSYPGRPVEAGAAARWQAATFPPAVRLNAQFAVCVYIVYGWVWCKVPRNLWVPYFV